MESLADSAINFCNNRLSYCGQNCFKIPLTLGNMYGQKANCLDLSYNKIETLKGLEMFGKLEELILDNNCIGDDVAFPELPHLRTLALNNNKLTDLDKLVAQLRSRCPALTYLSLLSNRACPDQLTDLEHDESDYQRYRYYVIHNLPLLSFLDSRRVSPRERSEAMKRGQFTRVRRLSTPAPALVQSNVGGRAMPVDFGALGKHKGAYGKVHYKYTGKHSEGNRFIVNNDL